MKINCDKCSKPTWKGCGKHIEQTLKDVPEDERCKCPRDLPKSTATVVKKTEETTTISSEIKSTATKDDHQVKPEETKVTTTTDHEIKAGETKEKAD
jgi:hypothetical protein